MYEHEFPFFLGVESLGYIVMMCLAWWETAKLFSRVVASCCTAFSSLWELPLRCVLVCVWPCQMSSTLAVLIGVQCYLIVVLICISRGISLVAPMVKHLSTLWETWVRSLGREHPVVKEMAAHSSTLAWKIPWTEEPGRLQSMGSQSRTWLSNSTTTTTWLMMLSLFSVHPYHIYISSFQVLVQIFCPF